MTVKSFGNEKNEIKAYINHLNKNFKNGKKKSIIVACETTLHKIISIGQPIILFWFSMQIFFGDEINEDIKINKKLFTPAKLSTFLRYSTSIITLYNAIKKLLSSAGVKRKEASMEKMYDIMDYKSSLLDNGYK